MHQQSLVFVRGFSRLQAIDPALGECSVTMQSYKTNFIPVKSTTRSCSHSANVIKLQKRRNNEIKLKSTT